MTSNKGVFREKENKATLKNKGFRQVNARVINKFIDPLGNTILCIYKPKESNSLAEN